MNWRPEGLKNPFVEELEKGEGGLWDGSIQYTHPRFNDFEAGADAMLEALKKLGSYGVLYDGAHSPLDQNPLKVWHLIIPDEESLKETH